MRMKTSLRLFAGLTLASVFVLGACAPQGNLNSNGMVSSTQANGSEVNVCTLLSQSELQDLMPGGNVAAAKPDFSPATLMNCDFRGAKGQYVNLIVRIEDSEADASAGFTSSKESLIGNASSSFKGMDLTDVGTKGYASYSKMVANVTGFKKNIYVTASGNGFGGDEENNMQSVKRFTQKFIEKLAG